MPIKKKLIKGLVAAARSRKVGGSLSGATKRGKAKVSTSAAAGKGTGAARKTKRPGRRGALTPKATSSIPVKQKAPSRAPKARDKRAATNAAAAKATVKKAAARKAARGATQKVAAKTVGKGAIAKKVGIAASVPTGVLAASALSTKKKAKAAPSYGNARGPSRKKPAKVAPKPAPKAVAKPATKPAAKAPAKPVAMRGRGAPEGTIPKKAVTKTVAKKKPTKKLTASQRIRLRGRQLRSK